MFCKTLLAQFLGTSTQTLDSVLKHLGFYSPFLDAKYTADQAKAVMVELYQRRARRPGRQAQKPP